MKNSQRPIDSEASRDRADEDLRHHADRDAGDRQHRAPSARTLQPSPSSASSCVRRVEEVAVGLQREEQPGDVGERSGRPRPRARGARPSSRSRPARRPAPAGPGPRRARRSPASAAPRRRGTASTTGRWPPCGLNVCWSRPSPPTSIAAPSTSRTLPMIEPTIDALTTSCRPSASAKSAMISSGALPKVTLSRPPMPGSGARRELLGRAAHQRRRRDDPERRGDEDQPGWRAHELEQHRDRDERNQQVGPAPWA